MKELANLRQQVDRDFLREWGLKVAEEIEHLTKLGITPLKNGSLEDAVEEAQIVLEMLDEKELSRRALELSSKLAELRLMIRSTRVITASAERLKLEAVRLARDMKDRLSRQLEVGARNRL